MERETKTVKLHEALAIIRDRLQALLPEIVTADESGKAAKGVAAAVIDLGQCANVARADYENAEAMRKAEEEQKAADGEQAAGNEPEEPAEEEKEDEEDGNRGE